MKEAELRNLQLDKQIKKEKEEENPPYTRQSISQTSNLRIKGATNAPSKVSSSSFDFLTSNPMFMPLFLGTTPEQKQDLIRDALGLELYRQLTLVASTSKQPQEKAFAIGLLVKLLTPEETRPAERQKMVPFDERLLSDRNPPPWVSFERVLPTNDVQPVLPANDVESPSSLEEQLNNRVKKVMDGTAGYAEPPQWWKEHNELMFGKGTKNSASQW